MGFAPTAPTALTDLTASELGAGLRRGEFSCREMMHATLARIHALNPTFNAIVNLADDDRLLAQADEADRDWAAGRERGWLHEPAGCAAATTSTCKWRICGTAAAGRCGAE